MKKFSATIAIATILGLLGWMNWDRIGPVLGVQPSAGPTAAPTAAPTAIATPSMLGALPPQRLRFALIDPTNSTVESFRDSMKADIIADVRNYLPPKPSNPKDGVPSIPGLHLTVRLVATNSLAYGQQNADISIPSIPGLPARPDMTASGALAPGSPYDIWTKSKAAWSSDYDVAVAAAASAVQTLGALNLKSDESSGITAGAAALALLAPSQGDVQFAVLSDLDENRPQQPANFNGHPILVIQPDPVGDIDRWDSLFKSFSSWASASGAGAITRVRPEIAAPAISTFITGK